MTKNTIQKLLIIALLVLTISACAQTEQEVQDPIEIARATFDAISTATAQAIPPTATPVPVKPDIQICIAQEPNTLSSYQNPNSSAQQVIQALSPQLISKINYQYQSIALKQIPSLENGDIQINTVEVRKGDWIIDRFGTPVQLMTGVELYPAGCQSTDCIVTYQEGTVQMQQATIHFSLRGDLFWSDGTELTAHDSVFAYQIDQQEDVVGNPVLSKTTAYQATSDYDLQWTGLPGYFSDEALTAIWQPLPQHLYAQQPNQPNQEFLNQAQALSWGPYQMDTWQTGQSISLTANPYAPNYETTYPNIIFKFIATDSQSSLSAIANQDCHILLEDTFSLDSSDSIELQQTEFEIIPSGAKGWLHLDFAVQHQSHDDGYNFYNDQPAFFSDVLTRQAIAQCINREEILARYPHANLLTSYLASNHPNQLATVLPYDPASANQLLDQAGWVLDQQGARLSQTNYILYDTKLALTLYTEDSYLPIAESIQQNLNACGIETIIQTLPAAELYANQADAPVFGRNFDLALFSWQSEQQDLCWLYQSEAIPGEDKSIYPYYWLGWNNTGWHNTQFDDFCTQAQNSLLQDPTSASQQAQQLFYQEIPSLPLIELQSFTAVRSEICGYQPSGPGINIFDYATIGMDEYCQ